MSLAAPGTLWPSTAKTDFPENRKKSVQITITQTKQEGYQTLICSPE